MVKTNFKKCQSRTNATQHSASLFSARKYLLGQKGSIKISSGPKQMIISRDDCITAHCEIRHGMVRNYYSYKSLEVTLFGSI